MPARNTLVQLLALYTDPESHNAQRHRQTDRQTDRRQDYANSRSYCVVVRSEETKHEKDHMGEYAFSLFVFFFAEGCGRVRTWFSLFISSSFSCSCIIALRCSVSFLNLCSSSMSVNLSFFTRSLSLTFTLLRRSSDSSCKRLLSIDVKNVFFRFFKIFKQKTRFNVIFISLTFFIYKKTLTNNSS